MVSTQQFISWESYLKVDHLVSKLLSVEVVGIIAKLQLKPGFH